MSLIEKLDGLARKWRHEAVITRAEAAKLSSHELISAVSMNDQAHTQDDCADELDAMMPAIRQAMIDAERFKAYHDATFDGYAVYAELSDEAHRRTSVENVADVLDALNRVARATGEGEGNG